MEKLAAVTEVVSAAEAAMAAVVEYLQQTSDPTAEAAHALIDTVLAAHGCHSPEGHIVCPAPYSVEPHAVGSGVLPRDTPVVVDIFPQSKTTAYWADITRTVVNGTPTLEVEQMFRAVCDAQALALSLIVPGRRASEVADIVNDYFVAQGFLTSGTGTEFRFAEGFVHAVGHGVSTKIHDQPRIGRGSDDVLSVGDVITIEPGLYYKQVGGVRVEDMVLVTESGYKLLTTYPRSLIR